MILLVSYFIGKPILALYFDKMQDRLMEMEQYQVMVAAQGKERVRELFTAGTLGMGIGSLLHGILMYFAAQKMNKWWWVFFKGTGIFIITGIGLGTMIVMQILPALR